MADIDRVRDKLEQWLQDLELKYMNSGENRFSLRFGSTHMLIGVTSPRPDDVLAPTYIPFHLRVLRGVSESPELYEYIAYHADDYHFGHLSLHRADDGDVSIYFTHTLLGDYVDFEEFRSAVFMLASATDSLDDELQARFGGERFYEGE